MSRSNTRSRRSQWKATPTTLTATVEGGQTTYAQPHRARVVTAQMQPGSECVGRLGRNADPGWFELRLADDADTLAFEVDVTGRDRHGLTFTQRR